MASFRVTCITRDRTDSDRRIGEIGFNGEIHAVDSVIEWLKTSDENKLWVLAEGMSAWVGIRRQSASGRLYLATEPDGYPLSNLENLPECR